MKNGAPPPAPPETAPSEDAEAPPTFKELWARWLAVRTKLTAEQGAAARAAGPVEFINGTTPPDALERVVVAAEGMVQG